MCLCCFVTILLLKEAMFRSRNFVFTCNNYLPSHIEMLTHVDCRYMAYAYEIGESGTPHLQGFVCFDSGKTTSAVIKKLPGCHVEVMRGTIEDSLAYCSKENELVERGERPMSQKKKGETEQQRWKDMRIAAEEGRLDDIDPQIRFMHPRTVEYHRNKHLRERPLEDTTEKMLWYYGKSGTGKSRKARSENPLAYLKMCNKWWDGYQDQDVVLIEDFDMNHKVLCHHLKIWADRYPFPAEIKGGSMVIRPKVLIVTSNFHPNEIWEDPRDLEPILRRFRIHHFDTPF